MARPGQGQDGPGQAKGILRAVRPPRVLLEALFRKPDTRQGRSAPRSARPWACRLGSPGPRRPLPRGEGHASRERCAEELPGPAAPRPRTPRRHVASPRMFGGLKARWWKREAWRWRSDCRDWGNRVCIGPSCPSVFGCLFGGGVQAPSDLSPTSDAPKGSFPCMKAARMVPSSLLPSDS